MFGWRKKTPPPPSGDAAVRDTLFGDAPIEAWPRTDEDPGEPWGHFIAARRYLNSGDTNRALAEWQSVTQLPDLESRHYLQAWHFLSQHGHPAPEYIAKQVLGIVIEVHLQEGLDLLAAYPEHTARYYNHSGGGVVWERPDDSLDEVIDGLLAAAATVAEHIGPWDKPRPGPVPRGQARLSILTPSGLHFGQADSDVLFNEALAAPTMNAATQLMLALIEKDTR